MRSSNRRVSGQSSVEYALVLLAFLAIVIALCAVWHASKDGVLMDGVRSWSSHNYGNGVTVSLMQDITSY